MPSSSQEPQKRAAHPRFAGRVKQMGLYGAPKDNFLDSKVGQINNTLLKMIVKDFEPLSIVENEGFFGIYQIIKTSVYTS